MKKISFDGIKINKLSKSIQSLLMFLITSLIIALIAPRDQKFQYTFTEGKPWQYDLLTAPYDFPILKTDADLSAEQDSLCERQMPYYNLNTDTLNAAINQWKIKFTTFQKGEHISDKYYNYVEDMLRQTYETGLMDEETKHNLRAQDQLEVMLNLPQKGIVERVPITIFKTVKEAYLAILEDAPKGIDSEILKKMNIAELLWTNVKYNSELTSEVTSDELRKLSISTGIIQKGERIVDKGEIVDAHIYNILNSYKISYQSKMGTTDKTIVFLATFVIIGLLFMAFWLYFVIFRPQFMDKRRNTILLVMLLLILIGITIVNTSLQLFNLYIIPFAMVPMIVRVFFDSRTAIFSNIICILSAALFVPYQYEFIVVQVLAGFVSVFSLRTLRTRVDIIRASFLVFLTYVIVYIVFQFWGKGTHITKDITYIIYFGINLIFLMFSYILIYLIERGFGYLSIISLMELGDMNSPLLKELSERAPGTFQHVFQVSILATEAAIRIGADAPLTRTGALYHDIGKMNAPQYFTENQGSVNPHHSLPYDESAKIIIKHVTDGIAMAQKYRLPDQIIDFIRTHHGKGLIKYFYNSYCNEHPGEKVNEEIFRYPGPNPFSKETAILMMADAVEASSRSLKEYTEENIKNLINRIVDSIVQDGLLNDAPISFKDIKVCKEVFNEKLKTMYHSRIAYPTKNV